MSLPTEDDVDRALQYLAATDEGVSKAIASVKAHEHHMKTEKAFGFIRAKGTVAEREAQSLTTDGYVTSTQEHENLWADMETLKAKRKRNELVIDVWRTCAANSRKGNI